MANKSFAPLWLGVWCAVLYRNQLLLSRRSDLNQWALPGGRLDQGERISEAAIREVMEETGIQARQPLPVGLYYLSGWRRLNILFTARARTYTPRQKTDETRANQFFPVDALPSIPLAQPVSDALAQRVSSFRVLSFSRATNWRLKGQFARRYAANWLRGKPEPRFPALTIRASALIFDQVTGNVLTMRGAATRMGEIRALPRLIVYGESAPWLQLGELLHERCGISPDMTWVGLWQDAPNHRIEFVFAAAVTPNPQAHTQAEWLPPRMTAFADIDAVILAKVKPTFVNDPVWLIYHEDARQAGDVVPRYNSTIKR